MSLENNFETLNNDVCIIIPTFNSWKITAETIDKLLQQTSKDFDIVVVDAGSKDYINLRRLYANNKRIIILHSPKDLGSAGSFWLGLKYAYE
jgi:GT2 family glycosyltransferase